MTFSSDSRVALIGSSDGSVRLWETSSGRERALLQEHGSQMVGVAFSPDGRLAITCTKGGRVFLWQVTPSACGELLGLYDTQHYDTQHEVRAIYWKNATRIILAGIDWSSGRPYCYDLVLEGMELIFPDGGKALERLDRYRKTQQSYPRAQEEVDDYDNNARNDWYNMSDAEWFRLEDPEGIMYQNIYGEPSPYLDDDLLW